MNSIDILNQLLDSTERRMRGFAASRGGAVTALAALVATVLLAVVANRFAFAPWVVALSRFMLFLSVGAALAFAAIIPLLRINRRNTAREMERRNPELNQRLLTFAERQGDDNPFVALLAQETAGVAGANPGGIGRIAAWLASAAGAVGVLGWLILAGPGYLGYGASLLWAGAPKPGAAPLYDITVSPGDAKVRRRADQLISARLLGFDHRDVRLKVRFGAAANWEETAMQPALRGGAYEFLLAAVPDSAEYFVESRGVRSKTHKLMVTDLPAVKSFRVTYHYPSWSGMPSTTEDPGGDLRAVEGTVAELTVTTEGPVAKAVVALDDHTAIPLEGAGNQLRAQVPITKDGAFHFAAIDQDQQVRLGEDYFIEARKDNPPAVKLTRPGRDAKVNPIEEVPLALEADDDFGLQSVELHYSVNGGDEKTIAVGARGQKHSEANTLLALEDYKLVPGDLVAVYATARDARTTTKTDIYFVEAQPFEREYSQSQQQGGGGGDQQGDQDESRISARQKEIIAATWNELKGRASRNASESAENARFLTEVQSKLRDQARSMSERTKSRALAGTNQEFQSFVKSMDEAVNEMTAASGKLKGQSWQDALAPEQRALQHLLRAESVFRQIQVAMGRNNQGGGGRNGGAARDLDNLFDLELDTEKNQYETGQQASSGGERQKEIDEALQKLEQLARRQQELANDRNRQQRGFEQRWEQEQLRREAEELRRKLEQLSRGEQGSQSASSSSSSGEQGQSSQQQGQSGQQSQSSQQRAQSRANRQMPRNQDASDRRLKEAFDRVTQATDDMRQSADARERSADGARRAAERLQEAKDLLRGMRRDQSSNQLDSLSERADRLAQGQREFSDKMRKAYGAGGQQPGAQQLQQLAAEKDKLAQDLDEVEKQAQKAARDLAGSERAASNKLREGLSELQQDDVRMRMKFSSNWIRRGLGSNLVTGESLATSALERMAQAVREAKQRMGRAGGKEPTAAEAEKAAARVGEMRQSLERQQQQNGGRGGGGQGADDTIRDLSRLRQQFGADSEIGREIGDTIGELGRDRGPVPLAGPLLGERIGKEVIPALEQLELQLRRQADGGTQAVRQPAAEPVPAGYGERIAEYFRKLSKGK